MHPVLFEIGPLTIHSYGVFVAAGFLLGLGLAIRQARKEGIPLDKIVDLGFCILLSGIIGSRLLFVIMNADHYLENPIEIFKIWEGGLAFYGGLLLAVPIATWYIKKNALGLRKTADLLTPSVVIGHATGKFGCFAAGCCYGRPAEGLPWAVTFTNPESLAQIGIPLHPAQLYESAGLLINFLILIILKRYKPFNGQLFLTYLLFYSVLRFIVEFFRWGMDRGFIISNITPAQEISILIFLGAVAGIIVLRKGRA